MNWQKAAEDLFATVGSEVCRLPLQAKSKQRLYVACSGGVDSVFALLWVAGSKQFSKRLKVLHFNHALRGDESDGDESFVVSLAEALGVEFATARASWGKDLSAVSEQDAREQRIAFFERAIAEDDCRDALIVTGHHADDIAETMLMRLSRGAGLQGLTAPRAVSRCSERIQFLRPLLGVGRKFVRETLHSVGASWREDASNEGDAYYRNRLRSKVIPERETVADRPLAQGVARSRALLEEDFESLEWVAEREWQRIRRAETRHALDRVALAELPKGLQRRLILRLGLEATGKSLTAAVVEEALDCLVSGESLSTEIASGICLKADSDSLFVAIPPKQDGTLWDTFSLPANCPTYLPDGGRLLLDSQVVDESLLQRLKSVGRDDSEVVISLAGKLVGSLRVRQRRPGDAFKPHGKSSPKKLKDLLISRKIKVEERDRLPVVCSEDGQILWVPGLPPSAAHLVGKDAEVALRLTYQRGASTF